MFKNILMLFLGVTQLAAFKYLARTRQIDYCLDHEWGEFVANPNDCKLFFLCGKNGEGVVAACPPNMLFNAETKICDNPENVECGEITTAETFPISTTARPTPAITTTDKPSKADQYCYNLYAIPRNSYALVFLPHPRNCQQYYMCYHGQALLQACSPKLNWNAKTGKCDLPSNAECVIPFKEEGEEEDVEVWPALDEPIWADGIKCPEYGEHIFPNVQRCSSFIYCVKGQPILQTCPFYQHFDVESARCKWRIGATCVKDLNLKYRKSSVRYN